MTAADEHEQALLRRIEAGVAELPGIVVRSRAAARTPTLLLTFDEHPVRAAYEFLAELDVNAPAGTFYAFELARRVDLPEGGLRVGLAVYNDESDVDRLLEGLAKFLG
jgi:selenocysteine lyase/cysteine desulfurase